MPKDVQGRCLFRHNLWPVRRRRHRLCVVVRARIPKREGHDSESKEFGRDMFFRNDFEIHVRLWKLALCQRGTVRIVVSRSKRCLAWPNPESFLVFSGPDKSFVECFECFTLLTWDLPPKPALRVVRSETKISLLAETLTWPRPNTEGCPCPAEPSPQHIPRQIDVGDREHHADHNHNADTSVVSQCPKITTPSLTTSQA